MKSEDDRQYLLDLCVSSELKMTKPKWPSVDAGLESKLSPDIGRVVHCEAVFLEKRNVSASAIYARIVERAEHLLKGK